MKKRKSIITLSSVLLVAVFALSCCFFSACGKDEEETHTHVYTGEYEGDATGHWQYCDEDGEKSSVSEHTFGATNITTEPGCETNGKGTHTCTVCGYEEDVTVDALGHDYDVTWEWAEDYSSATATHSACSRGDLEEATAEATIESETDGTTTTYTATATFEDGIVETDTKIVTTESKAEIPETVAYSQSVDFSVEGTYTWIPTKEITYTNSSGTTKTYAHGIECGQSYTDGILTLVTAAEGKEPMSIGDELEGSLNTSGATSENDGRYIKIDLTGYETDYVSIEVKMAANGDGGRSLFLSTNTQTPNTSSKPGLAHVTSSGRTDPKTLSYLDEISSGNSVLYLTCDKSINIYTIDITIYGDVTPSEGSSSEGAVSSQTVVALPKNTNITYNGTSFANSSELSVEFDSSQNTFTIKGVATAMTEGQAEAFGAGATTEDRFVVIGFQLQQGDTISWTTSTGIEKSWTKENDDDLAIVERVSEKGQYQIFTIDEETDITVIFDVDLTDEGNEEIGTQYKMTYAVDENAYKLADDQETNKDKYQGDFKTTYDGEEDSASSISVTYTGSTATKSGEAEKSAEDGSEYTYYVETKNSSRYFTIAVGQNVESAEIIVYASHTTKKSTRSLYIGTTLSSTAEDTYTDKVDIVGGEEEAPKILYTVSATAASGDTLYVYSSGDSDTLHVYAIVVTYVVA